MQAFPQERILASLQEAQAQVNSLDFALQKRKMVEVFGWHEDVVNAMEEQYRKFLALSKALDACSIDVKIVPTRLIDEFWHLHIMDTEKYHNDCAAVFNGYFHHYPYFGFVDDADVASWRHASTAANDVWKVAYGEDLYGDDDGDAYDMDRQFHNEMSAAILASPGFAAARCRTQCKPVKCK